MINPSKELIKEAKAELVSRGVDPAVIVQAEAERKQQVALQKAEWKEKTRQHLRSNRRHPLKLKENGTNPNALAVATTDNIEMQCQLYQTTGFADHDGGAWLVQQTINASQHDHNEGRANGTLSFMEGIAPQNALEGLLAAQMATCHNLAMEFSKRATSEGQTTEGIERNLNRANKMMRTFTAQVEALQKLRNKGQQKITVQHVQVGQGGQAIIGDVGQPGRG